MTRHDDGLTKYNNLPIHKQEAITFISDKSNDRTKYFSAPYRTHREAKNQFPSIGRSNHKYSKCHFVLRRRQRAFAIAGYQFPRHHRGPIDGETLGEMPFEAGAGLDAGVEPLGVVVLERRLSSVQRRPRLRQIVDEDFPQLRPRGGESLRIDLCSANSIASTCGSYWYGREKMESRDKLLR